MRHIAFAGEDGMERLFLDAVERVTARIHALKTASSDTPCLSMPELRMLALADYAAIGDRRFVADSLLRLAADYTTNGKMPCTLFGKRDTAGWYLDHALLFITILDEYASETEDLQVMQDVYPVAIGQLEEALSLLGKDCLLRREAIGLFDIDGSPDTEHTLCANSAVIQAVWHARHLAVLAGRIAYARDLRACEERMRKACARRFFDTERREILSEGQASCANIVWLTLSDLYPGYVATDLMRRMLLPQSPPWRSLTPAMYSQHIEALCHLGMTEEALRKLMEYVREDERNPVAYMPAILLKKGRVTATLRGDRPA